jgi:hypothetical protein
MIDPASSLLHPPRASLDRLTRSLLARPHGAADDATVTFVARLYFGTCNPLGIDPLVVIAQMRLETGNLTSDWSRPPKFNPAGIGVTGEPGVGIHFPNWTYAVRAHVGRLLAYAVKPERETKLQALVVREALSWRPLAANVRGAAPTLKGLVGTWAADRQYAAKISRVANEILTMPQ